MIRHVEQEFLFLKPGNMVVSAVPVLVTTLLGSCVAVTLYNPRLQLGAICHAQLPSCGRRLPCNHDHLHTAKFVECAIMAMLERLHGQGICKGEIEAKLFGGSDMFDAIGRRSVGRQNIEMALTVLERESVRLVRQDLGGERGRKIIFHTHTGEVFLKRLRKSGGY